MASPDRRRPVAAAKIHGLTLWTGTWVRLPSDGSLDRKTHRGSVVRCRRRWHRGTRMPTLTCRLNEASPRRAVLLTRWPKRTHVEEYCCFHWRQHHHIQLVLVRTSPGRQRDNRKQHHFTTSDNTSQPRAAMSGCM